MYQILPHLFCGLKKEHVIRFDCLMGQARHLDCLMMDNQQLLVNPHGHSAKYILYMNILISKT